MNNKLKLERTDSTTITYLYYSKKIGTKNTYYGLERKISRLNKEFVKLLYK